MRTFTVPQRARLRSQSRRYHIRTEARNIDGTWIDVSNRVQAVTIAGSRDTPTASATFTLIKTVNGQSGSPLMVGSTLNRDDADEYAPLFNNGNRIRFHVAVTAPTVAPVTEDWKHLFEGRIDRPDWAPRTTMTLTCRDLGGYLLDNVIDEKRIYSNETGQFVEVVMQQLIDDNEGNAVLVVPDPPDPAWVITKYEQPLDVPVLTAAINLSDQIAWDTRYDYQPDNNFPELLMRDVDREKTVPDENFTPSEYKDVPVMGMDDEGVRNDLKGWFHDDSIGGKLTYRRVKHPGSILASGRKFMQIASPYTDAIRDPERMTAMLEDMLADLAVPWADKAIVTKLWWPAQLGDLYAFPANDNHYDEEQKFSVVAYQHDFARVNGVFTADTTLTMRGQPSGGYRKWLEKAGPPGEDPIGLPNPKFGTLLGEGSALGGTANDARIWWDVEFDEFTEFVVVWVEESKDPNVPTPDEGSVIETSITLYRPEGTEGLSPNFSTTIPIAIRPNYYARVRGAGFNKLNQRGAVATPPVVQAIDNDPPYVDGTLSSMSVTLRALQDGNVVAVTVATLDPDTESWLFVERDNVVMFRIPLGTDRLETITLLDLGLLAGTAHTYNAYVWTKGQSGPPWAWVADGRLPTDVGPRFMANTPVVVAGLAGKFLMVGWECEDPLADAVRLERSGNLISWVTMDTDPMSLIGLITAGSFFLGDIRAAYYRLVSMAGTVKLTYTPPKFFPGDQLTPGGPSSVAPVLTKSIINRNGLPVLVINWVNENGEADGLLLEWSAPGAGVWTEIFTLASTPSGSWEGPAFEARDYRMRAMRFSDDATLATSNIIAHNGLLYT